MSGDILNPKNLYKKYCNAIVSILSIEGKYTTTSTGFLIKHSENNKGIYIVTVAHSVFSSKGNREKHVDKIYAVIHNFNNTGIDEFKKCSVIGLAGYADLAILSVDGLDIDNSCYFNWSNNNISIGDKCYVIGNPIGIEVSAMVE